MGPHFRPGIQSGLSVHRRAFSDVEAHFAADSHGPMTSRERRSVDRLGLGRAAPACREFRIPEYQVWEIVDKQRRGRRKLKKPSSHERHAGDGRNV